MTDKPTAGKLGQCSERVYDGMYPYQCSRKAVIIRDGKPYCKIHDPEYIKAKNDARKAKWDAEWAAKKEAARKQEEWNKIATVAVQACTSINPENPMAVAEQMEAAVEALRSIKTWLLFDDVLPPKEADLYNEQFIKVNNLTNAVLSAMGGK